MDYEQYYGRYSAGKYQQANLEYLNWIKRATPMVASFNSSSPSTSSSSLTSQGIEDSRCSSTSVQREVGMTKKNDDTTRVAKRKNKRVRAAIKTSFHITVMIICWAMLQWGK